ncbi:hypothetical protein YC2023_079149 [Brassica napus]
MLCWVMSRKKNIRDRRLEKKIRALDERRFLSIFDFSPSSIFKGVADRHVNLVTGSESVLSTILVNKEGNSWNVSLQFSESAGKYYITRGWRKFCLDNRCEIGDLFAFNVVGDGKTTPLMCVCPERKECSEILSKYLSRTSGESSLGGHL